MVEQWAPQAPSARAAPGVSRILAEAAAKAKAVAEAIRTAQPSHDWWAHGFTALAAGLVAGSAVFTPVKARPDRYETVSRSLRLTGGDLSERGLDAFAAHMDPAAAALARRFAPPPTVDLSSVLAGSQTFGRAMLDPTAPAPTALPPMDVDTARLLNASIPAAAVPNPAARPFFLKAADLLDETRAEDCLTAAVYYEAGTEARAGQQAVAQVVLNRLRHPAYPKTVCGVVFQGSNRSTGCQFTFTCDGSLDRTPSEAGWRRAREVAIAALNGFVAKGVGNATHYHADYVAPYWSTSMLKVATVGAHVFYRWTGQAGKPPSFTGLYAGAEPQVMNVADVTQATPAVDQAVADARTDAAEPTVSFDPAPVAAAPQPAIAAPTRPTPVVATAPTEKPQEAEGRRKTNWSRLPTRSEW